jgi:hypothetical protein
MLRSLYAMLDYRLAAQDGLQGIVYDFLFDEESWIVDYLVAETETTLVKSKVLILPLAVGQANWEKQQLPVLLTCAQIAASPPLDADMPISRQRELGLKQPGSHLRSVREVLGYSLHTADGEIGTIEDLIIEDPLWSVHYVVVSLKARGSILVKPDSIRSISWPGKAAWLNLSVDEIMNSVAFDPAAPVNRDDEHKPLDYYGRPAHTRVELVTSP